MQSCCYHVEVVYRVTCIAAHISLRRLHNSMAWCVKLMLLNLTLPKPAVHFFHQPQQKTKSQVIIIPPQFSSRLCENMCATPAKEKGQSMRIMRTNMRIAESQITKPLRSHDKITKHAKMIKRRTKENTSISTRVKCK